MAVSSPVRLVAMEDVSKSVSAGITWKILCAQDITPHYTNCTCGVQRVVVLCLAWPPHATV